MKTPKKAAIVGMMAITLGAVGLSANTHAQDFSEKKTWKKE